MFSKEFTRKDYEKGVEQVAEAILSKSMNHKWTFFQTMSEISKEVSKHSFVCQYDLMYRMLVFSENRDEAVTGNELFMALRQNLRKQAKGRPMNAYDVVSLIAYRAMTEDVSAAFDRLASKANYKLF